MTIRPFSPASVHFVDFENVSGHVPIERITTGGNVAVVFIGATQKAPEEWLTNPVSFEKSTRTHGVLTCDSWSLKNIGSKMKEMLSNY